MKKGGRITPAAAAIGTVLNLKPVLQIQGEKLDAFAKVRGWKAAKKTMLDAIGQRIFIPVSQEKRFIWKLHIHAQKEEKDKWIAELQVRFPDYEIRTEKLSLSVACHIGPGAMAVACSKYIEV